MRHKTIRVHQLFHCNERMTWIELRAFIYRSFFSNKYHVLIRPNVLSVLAQEKLSTLLDQLLQENSTHKFHLGIIATRASTQINFINIMKNYVNVYLLQEQKLLSNDAFKIQVQNMLARCIIITSRLSGSGKSTFIEKEGRRLHKSVLKFPISGVARPDAIADRLRYLYDKDISSSVLHLDIGYVENVNELNEILYCLILFRQFRFVRSAISIPDETLFYIELASSPFIKIHEHLVLCEIMKPISFDQLDWNDLDYHHPKVQLIAKYLNAIGDGSIQSKNINEDDHEVINHATCVNLIKTYFSTDKTPEFVTWTQLHIFITVYYSLFRHFSVCGYFLAEQVSQPQLRLDLLQALLRSSNQFTSLSVANVRKQQRSSLTSDQESHQPISTDAVVRWENTQPFTLVFTATNDPLFVYKTLADIPESLKVAFNTEQQILLEVNRKASRVTLVEPGNVVDNMFPDYSKLSHVQFFQKLTSLSRKYFTKAICVQCFQEYPYDTNQCSECLTNQTIEKPRCLSHDDIHIFQIKIANLIEGDYVLTPDNYVKMLLIYMRVQSGLPVLIMGETGCGKTALIKFLCQKVLDDKLEILRIHAGVTNEKIFEAMKQFLTKSNECAEEKRRLWIFFDEFNTTSSVDMLKEIICERTILGESLPDNMVFLGACNPYRHKSLAERISLETNIGIKKDRYELMRSVFDKQSLLYTVVPIPETMLEYLWDYGYLQVDTERSYIQTILNNCPTLKKHERLFYVFIELISHSQQYIRRIEDVSSVSLRDVARFCRLYNWFYKWVSLRIRNSKTPKFKIARRSAVTALFLCYYFRLASPECKREYIYMLEKCLTESDSFSYIKKGSLVKQIEAEQAEIINMMELPMGTGKNRALCENIFVLFSCIINRIPVTLCGKPGCSKTSAVQIVISNLNGKRSNNAYFATLPELVTVSYQGSQNCTSESILKVFERAEKYQKAQCEGSLLPVIVFDEIGLAELSPHNPLKVLHAELEVETCRYGFVGISNWRLDASKMNRVLYISCPDPSIDDLVITAKSIANGTLEPKLGILQLNHFLSALAKAYHQLFNYLKEQQENENYFGLRDFYSLVKGVIREAHNPRNEKNEDMFAIVRRQMKINFDGTIDGSQLMWEAFCRKLDHTELTNKYPVPTFRELLDRRINVHYGRYLMLIGERESAYDYVERYLRSLAKWITQDKISLRTLIGSRMPGDLIFNNTYTETYSYRLLMDIILHVETGVTLLLRQLSHLQDNLYDLFNQNFAVSAKKQYCRIALGALYHPRCFVNDKFSCIVFVNKDEVEKCDPPFLNRFEKHVINIHDLIEPAHWQITVILLDWLKNLASTDTHLRFPKIQHLFIGYNPDYVCQLVMDICEERSEYVTDDQPKLIEICKENILRCCSFDLPLFLAPRAVNDSSKKQLIDKYYAVHRRESFADVLHAHRVKRMHPISKATPFTALISRVTKKQIIYTYTQIYDTIIYDNNDLSEIKLSNMHNELEVINKVKSHFWKAKSPRILAIRIDYHAECRQLLSLKYILLNAIDDESREPSDRCVWLIIHVQRHMLEEAKNDVLFHGWSIDMIDDLNRYNQIPIECLMNRLYEDLIMHEPFILSKNLFLKSVDHTLSKFRYRVANNQQEARVNRRRNDILDGFMNDADGILRKLVEKLVYSLINTIKPNRSDKRYLDWREDLLQNELINGKCSSLNEAFGDTIIQFYETYFLLLFSHLEQHNFFDSLHFLKEKNGKERSDLENIWNHRWKTIENDLDQSKMTCDNIDISLVFDLRLPCAQLEYTIVRQISQAILKQSSNDDLTTIDFDQQLSHKLNRKTVYGRKILRKIFDDEELFQHYYHDHLCLFVNENNILLTPNFILQITSMNPTCSNRTRFHWFIKNWQEMVLVFRIFEVGVSLIGENFLLDSCRRHFLKADEQTHAHIQPDHSLYTIVLSKEGFYQHVPGKRAPKSIKRSNSNQEVFIENNLMNLLEILRKPETSSSLQSPLQLVAAYNLIHQNVCRLTNYCVDNLDRFGSYISPIRMVVTLVNDRYVGNVLKQIYSGPDTVDFSSCDSIHEFIQRLTTTLLVSHDDFLKADKAIVQRTMLKLEIELLKNWLIDHGDQYNEVLSLINRSDNELWRYSAKIFLYIDRYMDFQALIVKHHGKVPVNKTMDHFETFLSSEANHGPLKIKLLLVNYLHAKLVSSINRENFEQILKNEYTFLKENLDEVNLYTKEERKHVRSVGLIVWLKFYAQVYAFMLHIGSHHEVMRDIDKTLTTHDGLFGSTLKLFILKQIVNLSDSKKLDAVNERLAYRHVLWLRPLLARTKTTSLNRDIVLPTPLFEGHNEFLDVNEVLINSNGSEKIKNLIGACRNNRKLTYSFYLWFIRYYCRYLTQRVNVDQEFRQIIFENSKDSLIESFELIGFNLLFCLFNNFPVGSYFHLHMEMNSSEFHKRLIALNIFALCLSTRSCPRTTYLGTLIFNEDQRMPNNYCDHVQSVCLIGMISGDPIITQMFDVRTQIQDRLQKNLIHPAGTFIFQCSYHCHWMFYFENCGVPNDRNRCPLCLKEIGASSYGKLIERNPPQIAMSLQQGLQEIERYVKIYNNTSRLGYHNITPSTQMTPSDKPDHLNQTVSFRFLHMFTHAELLVLYELKYLTDDDVLRRLKVPHILHFHNHFNEDCAFLEKMSPVPEQYHTWLFKLINHMLADNMDITGILDSNQKVVEIERLIEQKLIFPHIESVVNEIADYRQAYTKFDSEISFNGYVDEIRQNEDAYPLLKYFNISIIQTVDLFKEFRLKMETLPLGNEMYPLTAFILKRIDEYSNIRYLHPIMKFSKYLINKYNHQIQRNDAINITIEEVIQQERPRTNIMRDLLNDFIDVWYKISLKEVRHGCQTRNFVRSYSREEFSNKTSLACLLLNKSKDDSSLLLIACIQTLARMQNEITSFFQKVIMNNDVANTVVSLHAIELQNLFNLSAFQLQNKLLQDCFVINYKYGQARDFIYDFEEIEMYLRTLAGNLYLFDTENIPMFTYQFELYNENNTLITNIRRRINQLSFPVTERAKFKSLLVRVTHDAVVHSLGFLDNLFTYLTNSNGCSSDDTIQVFVENHMHMDMFFNKNIFQHLPFSIVKLVNIIALYELIEEVAFDTVLRRHVKAELRDANLDAQLKEKFVVQTYGKAKIADSLKSPLVWIAVLKRLLMRILNTHVDLKIPLSIYIERTDLWPGEIADIDLQTFEIDDDILLEHSYCILDYIEKDSLNFISKNHAATNDTPEMNDSNIVNHEVAGESLTTTWMVEMNALFRPQVVGKTDLVSKQKLRV